MKSYSPSGCIATKPITKRGNAGMSLPTQLETRTARETARDTLTALLTPAHQPAWETHCGLAEAMRATGLDPKVAHQASAVAMRHIFSVDITAMQEYRD